jgi:uncharacterized protein
MASGLVALLDDVAAIAKLAASSLDDVVGAAGKAGAKAAGVVIDDTAVTPTYVVGLSPSRELPIIAKIALGSLRNKLLILLPVAIALSAFAPWALTPLLMVGGAFLCFEATEKIWEAVGGGHDHADEASSTTDPVELENRQVSGAIRTDLILSAEIMAIALGELPGLPIWEQAVILAAVGVAVTVGVYGVVGLIVKMDDIGLHLAKTATSNAVRSIGTGLVKGMPLLLRALSIVGTAAMLWVGGGIIVHGLEAFHLTVIPGTVHHFAEVARLATSFAGGITAWIVTAIGSAIVGIVVGGVIVAALHLIAALRGKPAH